MVALGISLMPAAESVVCRSSTVAINVTSAADIQNITDVLACTGGGTFHITWYTSATILQTIEVSNKKEVTVNGVGVPSIRGVLANDNDEGTAIDTDVGSDAGIFSVSNGSTLRLNNLVLEGGNAEHGGAVNLFSSSSLYVVGCTFANNSATNGGETRLGQPGQSPIKSYTMYIARLHNPQRPTAGTYSARHKYIHIKSLFGFRDSVRSCFSSRPEHAIRGAGILCQMASIECRLRGAPSTPLALPCPFRTSTWTRTGAERDKREVAKIPHVEEVFRRYWLYLNVCSAWMIYNIYWHHFQTVVANVWTFAVAYTTYYYVATDCEKERTKQSQLTKAWSKCNASVPGTRTQQNGPETIKKIENKHNERSGRFSKSQYEKQCFFTLFRRRSKKSFDIYWSTITIHLSGPHNNIPHEFDVYLSLQTKPGCTSKGRCDYQGIGVSNASLCGFKNCTGYSLLLLLLVNPFSTSTWMRMDAERDKRKARKKCILNGTLQLFLGSWCMERLINITWQENISKLASYFIPN